MTRVIKASINLIPEEPIARMVELAVAAERSGYHACWVYDEGLAARDVYVTLAAIAGATERVLLGPGITNPYTRHPGQTAAAIASLDELSGGRAFLGIGAGGSLTMDPLGLDHQHPLTAVRETMASCRSLFAGVATTTNAPTFSLVDARLDFGRPDIAIWLAGRGPKMLALGGARADGVMLDFIHKDLLAGPIAQIRSAAAATGNQPVIAYSTVIVTDADTLDFVRPHMTYRLLDSSPEVRARLGITDRDTARIRTAMAGGLEAAAEHVRDDWVRPFIISGTAAECRDELAALVARHHIDEFLLPVFAMPDAVGYIERIAAIAIGS